MRNEEKILDTLDRFSSILGLLAFATLILHFGFPGIRLPREIMTIWSGLLPTGLFAESLIRLLVVRNPRKYIAGNPFRYLTLVVIVLELSGVAGWSSDPDYSNVSLLAGQIYLTIFLLANLGSWARGLILANRWLSNLRIPVLLLPAISFAAAIVSGALLLWLPGMNRAGSTFLDSLFCSTSALCVTGLATFDVGSALTVPGKIVLALLIQIGGLGTMTIMGTLALWGGGGLSMGEKTAFSELIGGTIIRETKKTVAAILTIIVSFEAAGTLLLWIVWRDRIPHPLLQAAFHSVSAFCNAGFSLFPDSLAGFSSDIATLAVVMALIVGGGLGFPVIANLRNACASRFFFVTERRGLSGTTKTVLTVSAALLITGTVLFFFDGLASGAGRGVLAALFQSVTVRTAGFQIEPQTALGGLGWACTIVLMAVGASPQSTGGGIKTSVVARLFMRKKRTGDDVASRRRLIRGPGGAALVLVLAYVALGTASGFAIGFIENADLGNAFFESFSALGTVGLSRDFTPTLGPVSKILVILLMFTGRVLYPTFVVNLVRSKVRNENTADWA